MKGGASRTQGFDEGFGDATEAEAGAEDGAAGLDVADGFIGGLEQLRCGTVDYRSFGYRGAVEACLA